MKPFVCINVIVFGSALGALFPNLGAQYTSSDQCLITYGGENQKRSVTGNVNTECGGGWHSAPWGNWGVTSNYGHVQDGNQFPGYHLGTPTGTNRRIWQWNSCTAFHPTPNGQRSTRGVATHGSRIHRIPLSCFSSNIFLPAPSTLGCTVAPRTWTMGNNFMSLYELDWDGNDFITTLYFPATSISMSCNYYGCSSKKSDWVSPSRSTKPLTGVRAELRTKVFARFQTACAW